MSSVVPQEFTASVVVDGIPITPTTNPFRHDTVIQTGRVKVAAAVWDIAASSQFPLDNTRALMRDTATWIELSRERQVSRGCSASSTHSLAKHE